MITQGRVRINGVITNELGTKINPQTDQILVDGKPIQPETLVYILLNKPKNTITTTLDPEGRPTVMELVKEATDQRIVPVGRLDRNTTGLLLLTNDGELTETLTHPSAEVSKLYHVTLDRPLDAADLDKLRTGLALEDGLAIADKADFVDGEGPNHVGVEVHIGRNRIVRRMFEHMGYKVMALDRVAIGFLSKKGVPRGQWRHLTTQEIGFLKMLPKPNSQQPSQPITNPDTPEEAGPLPEVLTELGPDEGMEE